jgi:hypothetical protein
MDLDMYCVIPEEAAFSPSAAALVKFIFEDDREGTSGVSHQYCRLLLKIQGFVPSHGDPPSSIVLQGLSEESLDAAIVVTLAEAVGPSAPPA